MSAPASISVLIPTLQGSAFLERVLAALAGQQLSVPWDLTVVDSGSTDGTLELLRSRQRRFPVPFELRTIHPLEFDHGDTRNLLAAESSGELLVFLTQDAIPVGPAWLARLARNFDDPRVGGAYCRNVPRPDAELLTRTFSAADPGYAAGRREVRLPADHHALDPHARRLLYNFNDVASALRRSLWERHPFPRTDFGEDVLMARALLEAGHTVVYDDEAVVEHSHDHTAEETRARTELDGRFNAEHLDRICVASRADAATLAERQLVLDRAALEAAGARGEELSAALARARELRLAAFEGLWAGGRSPRRFPRTALLESGSLYVLQVVHGFPPDTWAGTEVYTLELSRELERRGHRVTVLARAPLSANGGADGGAWRPREDRFGGLRVLRVPTDTEHRSVRDSYVSEPAEALFSALLERERPDVVHFQHLLHLSARLPELTRAAGIPSVLTCHDYWGLCARVQLIRPDGVRCPENQGMGCYACVKGRPQEVPWARRWLGAVTPAVRAARAVVERAGIDLEHPIPVPGPPGAKLARRIQELEGLRRRQAVVLGGYGAADLRIAPSRFLRARYLDTGAFDPRDFVYSDNGIRTGGGPSPGDGPAAPAPASRAGRGRAQGPVRFGFVGSLVWYKGVDVLLEAFARLPPGSAALAIHGAFDPQRDAHHRRLQELAGPGVSFHGRFDNARLGEVFAGIDALVVPSVWFENSPITIHEAFLFRTPVLAGDEGGMAELLEGGGGLTFRTGDARDLARVMGALAGEPGRLAGIAAAGFPAVKSIAENARELEFRYRALACRRP